MRTRGRLSDAYNADVGPLGEEKASGVARLVVTGSADLASDWRELGTRSDVGKLTWRARQSLPHADHHNPRLRGGARGDSVGEGKQPNQSSEILFAGIENLGSVNWSNERHSLPRMLVVHQRAPAVCARGSQTSTYGLQPVKGWHGRDSRFMNRFPCLAGNFPEKGPPPERAVSQLAWISSSLGKRKPRVAFRCAVAAAGGPADYWPLHCDRSLSYC